MRARVKLTEASFYKKSLEYINSISYKKTLTDTSGEPVINLLGTEISETVFATPPNTADWALYLGVSKSTLVNSLRKRFPDEYERIKTVLEAYNTRELLSRKSGAEAVKFNLQNNFGWRDMRSDEDVTGAQTASQLSMPLSEKLELIESMKRALLEGSE